MLTMGGPFTPALQFYVYLSDPALDRSGHYVVNISFEQALLTMYVSFVSSFDDSVRGGLERRRQDVADLRARRSAHAEDLERTQAV